MILFNKQGKVLSPSECLLQKGSPPRSGPYSVPGWCEAGHQEPSVWGSLWTPWHFSSRVFPSEHAPTEKDVPDCVTSLPLGCGRNDLCCLILDPGQMHMKMCTECMGSGQCPVLSICFSLLTPYNQPSCEVKTSSPLYRQGS